MPRRGNIGLLMSGATRERLMIRVTCNWCRRVRFSDPEDMRQLLGDVEIDSLRMRLKCEDCGKREYMEVEGVALPASEREGKVMRKLESIRIIRRPVWSDRPM